MPSEQTIIGGRYELEALPIGQGGMGQVYVGYDQRLDRKVAVKLIRFPYGEYDEELVKRFRHEARIMAKLEHPGAPSVYEADVHDDPQRGPQPYLVMQYIDGITVDDLQAEHGPLPVGWAAAIAAQVVAVLHAAHGRGIFHRDLKPSNLMLCPDGTVKVLDFGLAMFHDPELTRLTRTGVLLGTPSYMSPEQVRGAAVGPQSDFYSLGLVLHEMLTGSRLFDGSTEYAVLEQQVNEPPSPVRAHREDVPAELDALILRMLSKRAEDRPSDAVGLHAELKRHATDLPLLVGVINAEPSSIRMYADVLVQISREHQPARFPALSPQPDSVSTDFSRGDLQRVRAQAESLASASRYGQAVEVLETVLALAGRVLGSRDADVLQLRICLAEVLFEGGDYRRAAPAFGDLVRDVAGRYGPRDDRVLLCRRQEAMSLALLGETGQAIMLLRRLLADEEEIYGPNEPSVFELRRQIGLLELGAGDTDGGTVLPADLTETYGPPAARRGPAGLRRPGFLRQLEHRERSRRPRRRNPRPASHARTTAPGPWCAAASSKASTTGTPGTPNSWTPSRPAAN
ncbi:serine/threonine protein kinase [Actinomadura pelletieri DSM 43383]|uniref:non-specific serine/threonine protein kinase n=1 Tax=Actinomadura pelletieri DSM 43383 TaxID=1120940 RepID=A0A495QL05_9ACTN|nr:serine/threonine-protein kinase [Actinomadura pelletieri]RKS73188.1 serine/threonine protein kinase [Actinomadura pelletieri DSM 43383]